MASISKRGQYQWQAKIRKKGYPVMSNTFDTKREAEAWAAITESEMTRGVFVDRSKAESTTFEDVINRYIKEDAPKHKGGDSEIIRLKAFLRDEAKICARAMATLLTEDFEEFRDKRAQKVQPATVKRDLGLLHSVIEHNRRRLNLRENPISDVRRPTVNNARDVRFQGNEEERLFTAIEDIRNPWLRPLVIFALETAMRRGELLSLRWENVNLEKRTALLPDTKNGTSREVPLSSRALEVLRTIPRSLDGKVFKTTSEGLKKSFERARKRADMEHFNFHDLRHESITRLFERGWNIMEVSAVSGHKDLSSLKRYTNLRASDLAKKLG